MRMTRPQGNGGTAAAPLIAVVTAIVVLLCPSTVRAETVRDYQWYLGPLKIVQAQMLSRGEGVTVAVIDSGVDPSIPELDGQVLRGLGLAEAAGTNGLRDFDPKGHGTGMAALIAGRGGSSDRLLGIAPGATILPISTGRQITSTSVASGIRWAVDHGAQVLSLSLASPGPASEQLIGAVRYALAKDVVVVAGAGNVEETGSAVGVPASIPGVIAVSGADRNARAWGGSSRGREVALAGPAVRIVSPRPASASSTGLVMSDGTSDAAAIVSGVAALVRSRFPGMDAANVVNRLIRTAKDQGVPGRDRLFGFGTVRPYEALTAEVPAVARNPLLPPGDELTSAPPVAGRGSVGVGGGGLLVWGGVVLLVLVLGVFVVVVLIVRSRRPAGPYPPPFRGGPPGFDAPRQRSYGGPPPAPPPPGSMPR